MQLAPRPPTSEPESWRRVRSRPWETRPRVLAVRARWWFLPLGLYVASRLADTVILLVESHQQVAMGTGGGIFTTGPTPASPSYSTLVTNYDGQWYEQIARHGYPATLPPGTDSAVAKTAWPFLPLYPMLVRVVMLLTRLPFGLAASLVSVVAAGAAVVLLYRLVLTTGGRAAAVAAVLSVCLYPSAVLYQAAYAEGLALLLIVACLWCLQGRRYWLLCAATVCLAFTRPIVPAVGLAVIVHGALRWRAGGFPVRERLAWAAAALVGTLGFFLWPAVAWAVTGEPRAYFRAEVAWDHGAKHYPSWLAHLIGRGPVWLGVLGVVVLAVVLVLVWQARRRGADLRRWSPIYTLYLLASTRPNSAMVRMMMLALVPIVPVFPARPGSPSTTPASHAGLPRWRWLLPTVAVGLVLQVVWVHWFFIYWRAAPPFGP